jgi:hypothetical protein
MIPVYITVRDLLDCPRNLAAQVTELRDGLPILLDNASTYPPTVEWLNDCTHEVRRGTNHGNNVAWNGGHVLSAETHKATYGDSCFVVTDGDIDLTGLPVDLLHDMAAALEDSGAYKSAVSLGITDIPNHNPFKDQIFQHESKFWKWRTGIDVPLYIAESDTHFCMYRAGDSWTGYDSVRLGYPYVARHVPWYWNPDALPPDAEWYVKHMDPAFSTWGNKIRHRKGWAE